MRKIIIVLIFLTSMAGAAIAQNNGSHPGAFARMGFGARSMSMGNASTSDVFGDVQGYYNPALTCWQEQGIFNFGYTFLNLDRRLNFISFAKKFSLQQGKQAAGISLSWLNAGVSDIDGRDNDTRQIGMLSTYENQFMLGTSFLLSEQLAIGAGFKLYYSKLYEEVTTTSVGIDIGAVYIARTNLSFGLTVRDIGAKYKWETSKVYGANGTVTENKFPVLIDAGASYKLPEELGSVSLVFESQLNPSFETKDTLGITQKIKSDNNYVFKAGGEINLSKNFKIRAGVDRIDLTSDDFFGNIKPGLGFGFYKSFSKDVILGIDYSFQLEPYTKNPVQNIGVVFKFN